MEVSVFVKIILLLVTAVFLSRCDTSPCPEKTPALTLCEDSSIEDATIFIRFRKGQRDKLCICYVEGDTTGEISVVQLHPISVPDALWEINIRNNISSTYTSNIKTSTLATVLQSVPSSLEMFTSDADVCIRIQYFNISRRLSAKCGNRLTNLGPIIESANNESTESASRNVTLMPTSRIPATIFTGGVVIEDFKVPRQGWIYLSIGLAAGFMLSLSLGVGMFCFFARRKICSVCEDQQVYLGAAERKESAHKYDRFSREDEITDHQYVTII